MKLRIRGDSLRFRLTKSEVTSLNEQGWWQDTVTLGSNGMPSLIYRIESANIVEPTILFEASALTARVPLDNVQSWAGSDRIVGIYFTTSWGTTIAIEKDFRCLDEQRDEDESDNFDNPNADTSQHTECTAG